MERLPFERALADQVAKFKAIKKHQSKAKTRRGSERPSAGGRE
jgi:hypothetical protein